MLPFTRIPAIWCGPNITFAINGYTYVLEAPYSIRGLMDVQVIHASPNGTWKFDDPQSQWCMIEGHMNEVYRNTWTITPPAKTVPTQHPINSGYRVPYIRARDHIKSAERTDKEILQMAQWPV